MKIPYQQDMRYTPSQPGSVLYDDGPDVSYPLNPRFLDHLDIQVCAINKFKY